MIVPSIQLITFMGKINQKLILKGILIILILIIKILSFDLLEGETI